MKQRASIRAVLVALIVLSAVMFVNLQPVAATGFIADYVYGQGGSYTSNSNGTTATSLRQPAGVAVDSVHHRLFQVDQANDRVLVFNLSSSNMPTDDTADYVIGQADFTSHSYTAAQNVLSGPFGVAYDSINDRLFVGDIYANRVLVFNTSTITNGMNASYVLGQTDFVSTGAATSQSGMNGPRHLEYDGVNNRLFVAELGNRRVLVFNTSTITNGMNASYVLGQQNYTNSGSYCAADSFNNPQGLSYDSSSQFLYVADSGNNRVEVFNLSSVTNGMNASYVIGQINFTTCTGATTQTSMNGPIEVDAHSDQIFVLEEGNNRVLAFSKASLANGMSAVSVYGQSNFTSSTSSTTAQGLYTPRGLALDLTSGKLFVADTLNNRTLVFTVSSSASLTVAAVVDPSFTFTIAGQASACNGDTNWIGGVANATSVPFGHMSISSTASAGQSLTVASNAGNGFSVYVRGTQSSQNLRSGGHNFTDVSGTYSSPATIGASEQFGYTWNDSTVGTSVTNPGSGALAALTNATTNKIMGSSTSSSGSGCIGYDIKTGTATPAGSYTATVAYTALPAF